MTYRSVTFVGLSHVGWDAFGNSIPNLHINGLNEYHNATRYRLDISEYSVRLLLGHYDNSVEFATGWTSFLVQGKAAIDSFSQEVNLRHGFLRPKKANWSMDIERLLRGLTFPHSKNPALTNLISQEFGNKSTWFSEFKDMRDSEGVHRTRASRNLTVTTGAPHRIQIRGHDVDIYSTDTILKINDVLETGYKFM
jgi:hypothetical protein